MQAVEKVRTVGSGAQAGPEPNRGVRLFSTGPMEKMDPPESTSGTGASDPSDGGDGSEAGESTGEQVDGAAEAAVPADAVHENAGDESELTEDLAAAPEEPEAVAPPVVVVMVTSGAGAWLEPALASLAAQDYPALSVLVLDNAADTDPTGRIAAVLPTA